MVHEAIVWLEIFERFLIHRDMRKFRSILINICPDLGTCLNFPEYNDNNNKYPATGNLPNIIFKERFLKCFLNFLKCS